MKTYTTAEEAEENALLDHGAQETFDGHNCHDIGVPECESCQGWDGHSRRCDCGNRRVYWAVEQDSEGRWYARAEAY